MARGPAIDPGGSYARFFFTERVLLGEAFGGDEETFARSRA
jgi:hypothetical protein